MPAGTVDAGVTGFVGLFAGVNEGTATSRPTATLEDINGATNNITAESVILVAAGGIGEFNAAGVNNNFLEVTASRIAATSTAGSIRVENLAAGTTTIDCITDLVCGAPFDTCGLTAAQDIILRSQGDVIINPAVNAATTPVNAGRLVCIESVNGSILDSNT